MVDVYAGFDGWYRDEWRRLVAALAVIDGDIEAARDSAAEAFARAVANWSRLESMETRTGWLYRVGLNVQRRRLRRAALERRLLIASPPSSPVTELPEPAVDIRRAIADLPRRQRVAVALTYFADLSQAEVAVVMGIRRGTVASTLFDARAELATTLKEAT